MANPCLTCGHYDFCEDRNTPFVRDAIRRGFGKCGSYWNKKGPEPGYHQCTCKHEFFTRDDAGTAHCAKCDKVNKEID